MICKVIYSLFTAQHIDIVLLQCYNTFKFIYIINVQHSSLSGRVEDQYICNTFHYIKFHNKNDFFIKKTTFFYIHHSNKLTRPMQVPVRMCIISFILVSNYIKKKTDFLKVHIRCTTIKTFGASLIFLLFVFRKSCICLIKNTVEAVIL